MPPVALPPEVLLEAERMVKEQIGDQVFAIALLRSELAAVKARLKAIEESGG